MPRILEDFERSIKLNISKF